MKFKPGNFLVWTKTGTGLWHQKTVYVQAVGPNCYYLKNSPALDYDLKFGQRYIEDSYVLMSSPSEIWKNLNEA
jgi:hypothetical protein